MNHHELVMNVNFAKIARSAGLVFPAELTATLCVAVATGTRAFLLEGEPGTGKTHLGRAFGQACEQLGGGAFFAQMNAATSDESLIRGVNLAGFVENDPQNVYSAGALVRACEMAASVRGPFVAIIDEWDKTRPTADGLLLAALEERVVVDSAGVKHADVPSNLIWWITSNASRPLHGALLRRVLRLRLDPPAESTLMELVWKRGGCGSATAATIVKTGKALRLTLPDMIRIATIAAHANSVEMCRFVLRAYIPRGDNHDHGADLWAAVRWDTQ